MTRQVGGLARLATINMGRVTLTAIELVGDPAYSRMSLEDLRMYETPSPSLGKDEGKSSWNRTP